MGAGEDFLLKWNDHHSLFFAGAEELCQSEEYTDVTLAAGQRFFSAHRLVLSICSPFFRALFKRLGSGAVAQKSVIFLKDVEPMHLELLLEYMYKGEIKVQEAELVNVLNAAQSLEIKGLTDSSQKNDTTQPTSGSGNSGNGSNGGSSSNTSSSKSDSHHRSSSSHKRPSPSPSNVAGTGSGSIHSDTPPRKRSKPPLHHDTTGNTAAMAVNVKEEHQEVIPVTDNDWPDQDTGGGGGGGGTAGSGTVAGSDGTLTGYNDGQDASDYASTVATGYEEMGYEGDEYYSEEGMVNLGEGDDREATCVLCCKVFSTKYNLKVHYRTVHEQLKLFRCPICDRNFSQNSSLNRHIRSNHQQKTTSRSGRDSASGGDSSSYNSAGGSLDTYNYQSTL